MRRRRRGQLPDWPPNANGPKQMEEERARSEAARVHDANLREPSHVSLQRHVAAEGTSAGGVK